MHCRRQPDRIINKSRHAIIAIAVFIGDSLLQWFTREGADSWRSYFTSTHNCVNLGVPGDSTDQTIQRLQEGVGLLSHPAILPPTAPKLCVLLIGTNDIGRGRAEDYIAAQIGEILHLIKAKLVNVQILLLGLLPRQSLSHKPAKINEVLAQYDDCGKSVRFLDVSASFSTVKNGKLVINSKFYSDGLHLTREGYRMLAESIAPVFSEMMTMTV